MSISGKTLVLVVGAPKAGTFSLYQHFANHEEVQVSRWKEPNYFVEAEFNAEGMKYIDSDRDYIRQFDVKSSTRVILEASPSYLRCPKSPGKILSFAKKHRLSGIKIIISLRDPVDRAFSNWMMDVRQGHQVKDFKSAFFEDYESHCGRDKMLIQYEYFRAGLYFEDVNNYINSFGHENVFVIGSKRLKEYPLSSLNELERFIGIRKSEYIFGAAVNDARIPRNRVINYLYYNNVLRRAQRFILNDVAKDYIRRLLFRRDKRKISSFLTTYEIDQIYSCYRNDFENLRSRFGPEVIYWGQDE